VVADRPTCPACDRPMDICTTADREHASHDAPSPHYAALHTHDAGTTTPEGLTMLGVGYYEREQLDAGA
jgi:hypothetical protein